MVQTWRWMAGIGILLLAAAGLSGCRPAQAEVIQGIKTIRVDGEEIVVTRAISGMRDIAVTPAAAASPAGEAILDIGRTGDSGQRRSAACK
jgi:hypothetical protein